MSQHEYIPPSQEPEAVNRRNFLKLCLGVIGGLMTLSITWPFVSYLIPASEVKGGKFIKVPNFKGVPINVPTKLTFGYVDEEGFLKRNIFHDIWVVKHSAAEATVYSPLCPHLNCRYDWNKNKDKFMCPCHGSIFTENGKVVGGPAPRPLDTLPHKIENEELYVKWELFKAGIPEKVEI